MNELRQKLLATFQVEHREHLERIRAILGESDRGGRVDLDEIFRRAHSLKGAARVVDLGPVEALAHRLETLFAQVREGRFHLDRSLVRIAQRALDATEDWVTALAENRAAPDVTVVLRDLESTLGIESETPAPAPPIAPAVPSFQKLDTVRLDAEALDRLLRSAGQLLAEIMRQESLTGKVHDISLEISELEKGLKRVRKISTALRPDVPGVPKSSRLARHMDSMGHRARALASQARYIHRLRQRSAWTLRHLGDRLHQDIRRTRMVTAESIYDGFRKMVRDLAHDEGKQVEFHVEGFEVQADRMVLQALRDPLMHLLRNAICHGIETPPERASKGKAAAGRLTLHMDAHGGRLLLSVEDDGRGVDLQQVRETAVRASLLTASEAASCTPRELIRLTFRPGFSTAPNVTERSGRGMGLSVVYEAVTRLQGEVELRPSSNGGAIVSLSVPLSVSTHRLLLVACRRQVFCIPHHAVERLHRIRIQDVQTIENSPVVCIDGEPIPILSLAQLLGFADAPIPAEDGIVPAVVLRCGNRRAAVAVDGFQEERDALIQDLGMPLPPAGKLAGGTVLPDGSVALVLNPIALVEDLQRSNGKLSPQAASAAAPAKVPTIMVVDDSITTRTLEKSILEASGYQVRVAVDGLEALTRLRAEPSDLVIADIEMPRMDGFALLAEMRKDPRLAATPVIIVSSVERREDQERGLALGADAYIVKRKFDQRELLETIRQIL